MTERTQTTSPALEQPTEALEELAWQGQMGAFAIALAPGEDGGTLSLTPPSGETLVLRIRGDELQLQFSGSKVQFTAPDARMEFQAKSISLQADEAVEVHAGKEVDIHSGVDVEVRADHHVNLWGHGVLVGD